MEYARLPLFPKNKGPIALPFVIRETSEPNEYIHYTISVHPAKLHQDDDVDFAHVKIQREEIRPSASDEWKKQSFSVDDLNIISNIALKEFIFIDDGSFADYRLSPTYYSLNRTAAESLRGKRLFNLSNVYAPLRIYRLKRDFRNSCPEKPTSKKVSKTNWTMEVLDHSQNVPCARSGHTTLVDCKNNYLYLFGGVTILGLKQFQGEIDDIDNNWFYYPLKDVWRMDLETGIWTRLNDLSMKPQQMKSQQSVTPSLLGSNYKLPKLLTNLALVYDYKNDLIYGCYSPIAIFKNRTQAPQSKLFSFDPAVNGYQLEAVYTMNGSFSLAIAHEYDKLFIQFQSYSKGQICKIHWGKLSNHKFRIGNWSKTLSQPPADNSTFKIIFSSRIKYFGHGQFTASFTFPAPSEDATLPSIFPSCEYRLYNWTGVKNAFTLD